LLQWKKWIGSVGPSSPAGLKLKMSENPKPITSRAKRAVASNCGRRQHGVAHADAAGDEALDARRRREAREVGLEAPDQLVAVARRVT
jgi:hypothetical protein